MQATVSPVSTSASDRLRVVLSRWLYVSLVGLMSIIVLLGFWPFYSGLFSGEQSSHWLIYVHAAVFTGWMVLLAVQASLIVRRRIRSHQALGRVGAYYGLAILILGLAVTVVATADHVRAGRITLDEGAGFLVLPLGDMLLFAGFFGAAIVKRRSKELHKRLMVLSTIALLFAPAARIAGQAGPVAILAIWLLPLAVVVVHDILVRRRVERVYIIGTLVLLVAFTRIALTSAEVWLNVGRSILQPFL